MAQLSWDSAYFCINPQVNNDESYHVVLSNILYGYNYICFGHTIYDSLLITTSIFYVCLHAQDVVLSDCSLWSQWVKHISHDFIIQSFLLTPNYKKSWSGSHYIRKLIVPIIIANSHISSWPRQKEISHSPNAHGGRVQRVAYTHARRGRVSRFLAHSRRFIQMRRSFNNNPQHY
jgi:hypothetical protein